MTLTSNSLPNSINLFINSIHWEEDKWIYGIFFFHFIILLFVICIRDNINFQINLFILLILLVYASESINKICSTKWKRFSSINYFDKNGHFITIIYSFPLLCILLIEVVNYLYII